jgi:hypothetical protein
MAIKNEMKAARTIAFLALKTYPFFSFFTGRITNIINSLFCKKLSPILTFAEKGDAVLSLWALGNCETLTVFLFFLFCRC